MERIDKAYEMLFSGEQPTYSTGICENITCGFGRLDEYGYFEFPLTMEEDKIVIEPFLTEFIRKEFEKIHCGNNPHNIVRNEHNVYVYPSVQDAYAGFYSGYAHLMNKTYKNLGVI